MTTMVRSGRDLIDATRPFAREDEARSWFHTVTTLGLFALCVALAASAPWWPVRVVAAAIESLVAVRAFILFHDHLHGALLRDSRVARVIFHAFGMLVITPPRIWADTHNAHHATTARLSDTARSVGTYELWTVDRWNASSPWHRFAYRFERHPLTMLFGYVTVFFVGLCVIPFAQDPRRYASSGVAGALQVAMAVSVWHFFGAQVFITAMLAPLCVAYAFGAYLFYAQHNYPSVEQHESGDWEYAGAAVDGSSHLATGPVMAWFTGNIGYHHVHHLNSRIPFYRLPEAMAAIPELQTPGTTTLSVRDVLACLRLDLWDPRAGRMVRFAEVRKSARTRPSTAALCAP